MHDQLTPRSSGSLIGTKQGFVGDQPSPQDNPLADTAQIALPRAPGLDQDVEPSPRPDPTPRFADRETFEREVRTLNASIVVGGLAVCATLCSFIHSGVPLLLHNASEGMLVALGTFKGLELIATLSRSLSGLSATGGVPEVAAEHQERLDRVRALLEQVCMGRDRPAPHIVMPEDPNATAVLVHRVVGGDLLMISPQVIDKLTDRELKAILAHEVAHQGRHYMKFLTAVSLVGSLARPCFFVGATVAAFKWLSPEIGPLFAFPLSWAIGFGKAVAANYPVMVTSLYVNRRNELKTDLRACQMTGDPEALISALEKVTTSPAMKELESRLEPLGLLSHPTFEVRAASIRKVFGAPSESVESS